MSLSEIGDIVIKESFVNLGNNPLSIKCRCISIEKNNNNDKYDGNNNNITGNAVGDHDLNNDIYEPYDPNNDENDDKMEIICLNDGDLDSYGIRESVLQTLANFCVVISGEKIVKEILASYQGNNEHFDDEIRKKIYDQMMLDFPRMVLQFGGTKCNDFEEFKQKISIYQKYHHKLLGTLYWLLMMLCTQASFYYPYNIITNIYTLNDLDIYILPSPDDYPLVNIVFNNDCIDISFEKSFVFRNINNNDIITNFHTVQKMKIALFRMPDGYIFCGEKCGQCENAVVYWTKDKKLIIV